jgi:hypothetical protein
MDYKIDLMIVGAQKAGTTSLKNYLGQHPAIVTHEVTEFAFFVQDNEYKEGFERALKKYFRREDLAAGKKIIAKNAAIYGNEKALYRLQQHNPECIIVLVIRDPVGRAYSSYNMEYESGWFTEKWSNIIDSIQKFREGEKDQMFRLFIELGMYSEQLKKIYRHFPKEQVEIVFFEDMKTDSAAICKRLFKKTGTDESFIPDTSFIFNPATKVRSKKMGKLLIRLMANENPLKRAAKVVLPQQVFARIRQWLWDANTGKTIQAPEPMSPEIRKALVDFFQTYNEELEQLTGLSVKRWNY